ncbi:hypothetical protein A3B93_00460 [Candidatus Nomurabacteria bacterium RIFCSPHIGHO2_02_FULL_42_24]|uniref:Adenylate kinase n=1 Tax=Candidatus Nomurabacteria bacterium RIFCSPHIGHO2_02_FULL_42_24 TaxID=1801757 RepID=A0A1F6WGR0_9BACT|nr:MAG: hypothetical protein UV08_C0021G0009 [Parcubacteria group bacterium GW2011_GWA2_42_18]OGI81042.1 MAG: hypothetical protein A3B93_00460 [Candidatus Nomurabacteria bacterium RIFCSPHIGHO2_02_FULL_42_24]
MALAYLFFGRSGCGKGTQAKLLIEYLEKQGRKTLYVETGAGLRKLIEDPSYTSRLTKETLGRGALCPSFQPIWIWSGFFIDNFTGQEDLVLDGVCRKLPEAMAMAGALDFYGIKNCHIILINVSNEWSMKHLLARGRAIDDTEEKIQRRLGWFDEEVMPAIEYLKKNTPCRFHDINGEQTIPEVWAEISQKVFDEK